MNVVNEGDVEHRLCELDVPKVTRAFCRRVAASRALLSRLERSKPVVHKPTLDGHAILIVSFRRRDFCDRKLADLCRRPYAELYSTQYLCRFFHHLNPPLHLLLYQEPRSHVEAHHFLQEQLECVRNDYG